ncbi:hypothetical protein D3C72_1598170 [compost metagenome]
MATRARLEQQKRMGIQSCSGSCSRASRQCCSAAVADWPRRAASTPCRACQLASNLRLRGALGWGRKWPSLAMQASASSRRQEMSRPQAFRLSRRGVLSSRAAGRRVRQASRCARCCSPVIHSWPRRSR